MKTGDAYESPSGLGFVIERIDSANVHVLVERVYRKNGKQVIVKNPRVIRKTMFEQFAAPYKPVS